MGSASQIMRRLFRSPLSVLGIVFVLVNLAMVLFPEQLAPYDPHEMQFSLRHQPPSAEHWLGTDFYGRDILSRIIFGARVSFLLGLSVVACSLVIGTAVGLFAGYYGGRFDTILMRVTDVFLTLPSLLLALAIMAVRGPGFSNIVLALVITSWTGFARVVRAEVLTVRGRDYAHAARSIGAGDLRIIARHVLPNVMAPIIVYASMGMAAPILMEAALSFLGLGLPPDIPTWGLMLSVDRDHLDVAWWSVTFPGLAIAIAVLGFNLLGDGLRDALDPKLKQ